MLYERGKREIYVNTKMIKTQVYLWSDVLKKHEWFK